MCSCGGGVESSSRKKSVFLGVDLFLALFGRGGGLRRVCVLPLVGASEGLFLFRSICWWSGGRVLSLRSWPDRRTRGVAWGCPDSYTVVVAVGRIALCHTHDVLVVGGGDVVGRALMLPLLSRPFRRRPWRWRCATGAARRGLLTPAASQCRGTSRTGGRGTLRRRRSPGTKRSTTVVKNILSPYGTRTRAAFLPGKNLLRAPGETSAHQRRPFRPPLDRAVESSMR